VKQGRRFSKFHYFSGLKANPSKSLVFCSGVPIKFKAGLSDCLKEGSLYS
jgi:hypothetical protein